MSTSRTALSLLISGLVLGQLSGAVCAQAESVDSSETVEVVTPVGAQPRAANLPDRGATRDTVISQYGEPAQKFAAVGEPPISRWQYPGFTVYFENDNVIHSVAQHQSQ